MGIERINRNNSKFNYRGAEWWLLALFFILLCSKNCIFHALVFASSMHNGFWQYILSQIAIPLLLASFVLVTRTYWWTLIVLILADVWTIANWLYYLANGLFLSLSIIKISGNLNGFADSIMLYSDWRLLLFVIPTLVYGILLFLFPLKSERRYIPFVALLVTSLFMMGLNNMIIHIVRVEKGYEEGELSIEKCMPLYINEERMIIDFESEYSLVQEHSILADLPLVIEYEYKMQRYRDSMPKGTFSESEKELLHHLLKENISQSHPIGNLVIIIVESLESWTFHYSGVIPHLTELLQESHTLYADKVQSQVRHGVSGDGQMIINTGLLPLQTGAACILYGDNVFPNIAGQYPASAVINPTKGTWNQSVVSRAYGFRELYEPNTPSVRQWWTDAEVFSKLWEWVDRQDTLFCAQAITIASHAPFNRVTGTLEAITPDTPDEMRRYLTCLHYTDSCIGVFIDSMRTNGKLENTTVLVTGDHTVFHKDKLDAFHDYAVGHNLSISEGNNYVPLLISSPSIAGPMRVDCMCYQMDIFQTVMHCIGCDGYFWNGFGVPLSDIYDGQNRPITDHDAYILSEKLIRSNYFKYAN